HPPPSDPSLVWGLYSTSILLNEKLTRSTTSGPFYPSPPSSTSDVTRPCSIVILRKSSGDLPDFRCVKTALVMSSLLRSDGISAVYAVSMRLTTCNSRTVALPVATPPPSVGRACMPHVQLT